MKTHLGARSLVVIVFAIGCTSSALGHTDVTVAQARGLVDTVADLLVVDVRERYEYCDAKGHIAGAVNYPLSSGALEARYGELPTDRPILVVCRSGGRSNAAANFLDSRGFAEVYDMMGGMSAWTGETVSCKYSGGSGTAEDPYQISTPEDMQAIGADPNDWGSHFVLMNDIDLGQYTGSEFNMIGKFYGWGDPRNEPFVGVFDGNNKKIMNFTYETSDANGVGLFALVGYIGQPPEMTWQVRNLGLENVDVNVPNGNHVGALCGVCRGMLEDCYAKGSVSAIGGDYIGGLIGEHEGPWLRDSHFRGEVAGANYVGGLTSFSEGVITGCFSAGSVAGINYVGGLAGDYDEDDMHRSFSSCSVQGVSRVGGLVGFLGDEGDIFDCYATGDIAGTEYVGGLAGFTDKIIDEWGDEDESAEIRRSYATGRVTGSIDTTGGLVGYNRGRVTTSYWDTETSGAEEPGSGTGLPTSQLNQQATFEGWDFINVWDIGEGQTYPFLRTHLAGDVNKDGMVNFIDLSIVAERWMEESN